MQPGPIIEVTGLSCSTPDGRPLVQDLSFALMRGDILAVVGRNGAGKSTLLRTLRGEIPATAGYFRVNTRSIAYLSQLHNREFHIPLRLSDVIGFDFSATEKLRDLPHSGLIRANELNLAWNTASGGERQKTLLTQVLLASPELLVLDEPMNHLDPEARKKLMESLTYLTATKQSAVLMVCHETALAEVSRRDVRTLELSRYAPTC